MFQCDDDLVRIQYQRISVAVLKMTGVRSECNDCRGRRSLAARNSPVSPQSPTIARRATKFFTAKLPGRTPPITFSRRGRVDAVSGRGWIGLIRDRRCSCGWSHRSCCEAASVQTCAPAVGERHRRAARGRRAAGRSPMLQFRSEPERPTRRRRLPFVNRVYLALPSVRRPLGGSVGGRIFRRRGQCLVGFAYVAAGVDDGYRNRGRAATESRAASDSARRRLAGAPGARRCHAARAAVDPPHLPVMAGMSHSAMQSFPATRIMLPPVACGSSSTRLPSPFSRAPPRRASSAAPTPSAAPTTRAAATPRAPSATRPTLVVAARRHASRMLLFNSTPSVVSIRRP